MNGKISLEEHFGIPETVEASKGPLPAASWNELRARLLDIQDQRVQLMDEHGIEMMLLSLNSPVVQAIPDVKQAVHIARISNDYLAAEIAKRPNRFAGLAAVPLQDPEAAVRELTRCVKDLGFKGVLVNGFSQAGDPNLPLYYDLPRYLPFWQLVEQLNVPFYLHPRRALPQDSRIYEGHRWMTGAAWGFAHETAVHALRLMASGLFDKFPRLTILLGHLGEGLPAGIWRVDNCNAWAIKKHDYPAKKKLTEYFLANFYITTSGNFRTQTLIGAMLEIGADRIMFSSDWPFENIDHAANWFDAAPISEPDRLKIGRTNALRVFKLGVDL
jgi:predicted TIM-barrel fold metal-dependent hydrolase